MAFGVAALILASAFIEWIFWATREGTIQQGLGHIHVARKGYHEHGTAEPRRFLLPAKSDVAREILSMPEVRTLAPRLSFTGLVSHGEATLGFLGEAVDPDREKNIGDVSTIIDGEALSSNHPQEIILGAGLASNLGARTGDQVVLLTNTPGGGVNAVEVKVRGLFRTVSKAYDDVAIRAPSGVGELLTRSAGGNRWVVALRSTDDTPAVLAGLRARYAGQDLEFVPWYELADFYRKTVDLLSRQMGFMRLIIGLMILLTIVNSMVMNVMQRTSEIGTSMALGVSSRGILAQFLAEGLMLGAVGAIAGAAGGVGLAEAIDAVGIPMPPPPGQTQGFRAGMIPTWSSTITAMAIAVVAALGGAVYPAWRAARIRIVDALRSGR